MQIETVTIGELRIAADGVESVCDHFDESESRCAANARMMTETLELLELICGNWGSNTEAKVAGAIDRIILEGRINMQLSDMRDDDLSDRIGELRVAWFEEDEDEDEPEPQLLAA